MVSFIRQKPLPFLYLLLPSTPENRAEPSQSGGFAPASKGRISSGDCGLRPKLAFIAITKALVLPLRAANSWDIAALNEILIEKDYGASFPGYRILDVGAYNGDTPLFFAAYGAEKVIAAEPAPDNYALARKNITDYPYSERIELLPVAVAAIDGEMTFHLAPRNPQCHTLSPTEENAPYVTYTEQVKVPVWSFARLVAPSGWEAIDLVRLDCEGAEFPIILETPPDVLKKVRKWVIEYHADPQPLEKRLRELGYAVQRVKDFVLTGIIWSEEVPPFPFQKYGYLTPGTRVLSGDWTCIQRIFCPGWVLHGTGSPH